MSQFKKQEVIQSRRLLKGTPIVIKEDLTKYNMKRLQEVQEVENVIKAWSDDGKIIALLDTDDKVQITYKTDLSKAIQPVKKKKISTAETETVEAEETAETLGAAGESGDEPGEITKD